MAAAEAADLALHAALLVRPVDAGAAEERVEPVVAAQRGEPFGLGAVTPFEDPDHRGLEVVIPNPARDTTEVGEFSGDEIDYQKQESLIFAPIHEATDDCWDRVFRTNSGGVFRSMRAELRQMVDQGRGGAIVNVASIAGMTALAGNPAYVASKHAVNGLTRNAAIDYAAQGIRVNSVNMPATDTRWSPAPEYSLSRRPRRIPRRDQTWAGPRPSACWPTPTPTTGRPP